MRRFSTLVALGMALALLAPAASAQSQLSRQNGSTSSQQPARAQQFLGHPGLPAASLGGSVTITQNSSQTILPLNAVACGAQGITAENSYLRVFDLEAEGVSSIFIPTSVEFGIETASATGGSQPAVLRFYTLTNPAGPVAYSNFTSLGETSFNIPDQDLSLYTVPVPTTGTAPAGSRLVVELHVPDTDNSFYPGTNNAPEDGPTYIASATCGIPNPSTYASIGFPGISWVLNVTGSTAPITGPNLLVSPSTVAFGDVPTGDTSTPRTVTLLNNGTETVTITSITDSGAPFTVDLTGTDLTLDPDETTTLSVTFTPPVDGPATGTITIESNAPNSPQTVNLTGSGFSPPANDNREDAFEITADGTYTGTNVEATVEPGEEQPACSVALGGTGGVSVWWVYTPAENGLLTVDLLASDYDTSLALYEENGTLIDCNEDAPGASNFQSRLANVPVTAGEPVYIRVGGWRDSEQGNISLDLSFTGGELTTTAIPAGDTSGGATWTRPTSLGSGTSGSCTLSGSATAVPYKALPFNVTGAGSYTITTDYTATSGYDGYLFLYQGTFSAVDPCLNLVALDDDFNGTGGSQIEGVNLSSGDYVLVVTGFGNDDFGAYTGTVVGPAAVTFNLVADEDAPGSSRTMLTAAPNPAHSAARVRLAVGTSQDVTVAVFDVTGRRVAMLFEGAVAADQALDLAFDASSFPAGVYVIRASGTDLSLTERITVVR